MFNIKQFEFFHAAYLYVRYNFYGACRSAVRWGTTLQDGRSQVRILMVSLEFFDNLILPAALWPWGRLSLWQKWVPGIFTGVKDGRCVGLHVPTVWKSGSLILVESSQLVLDYRGVAKKYNYCHQQPLFPMVYIIQMARVYSAVRTQSLYIMHINFSLQRVQI
jgi:hypothetical protein